MAKRKYNEEPHISGDLGDLKGLPKNVNLGEQKKRISAQVEAGRAHIEGDETLGKRCVTALRSSGEFKRATQGFHTYPARLHPDAARLLLEALPGKSLGDPFCGGGTLLVEALIQGREVHGSDLNPVATLVATSRTALLSPSQITELETLLKDIHQTACQTLDDKKHVFLPQSILKYKDWYQLVCFNELAALYDAIRSLECDLKPLCQAVFSSLVIKYSKRASDTSNKVVNIARKPGCVVKAFAEKAKEYVENLRELQTLVPPGTHQAEISLADARFPKFKNVDTIITSPPYPGTYDYLPLQQLRQAWFDLDMKVDSEIGSRRSFKTTRNAYEAWLKDTDNWMASAANALSIGGRIAIVVGEGIQAGRSLKVAKPTMSAAQRAGLKFVCCASVDRRDPATDQKKIEYIIVFEKIAETPSNVLPKPPKEDSKQLGSRATDIRDIKPFTQRKRTPEFSDGEANDHRDDRGPRDDRRRDDRGPREERRREDRGPREDRRREDRGPRDDRRREDRGPRDDRRRDDRAPRDDRRREDRGPREDRRREDRGPRDDRRREDRGPRDDRRREDRAPRDDRRRDDRVPRDSKPKSLFGSHRLSGRKTDDSNKD